MDLPGMLAIAVKRAPQVSQEFQEQRGQMAFQVRLAAAITVLHREQLLDIK